MRAKVLNPTPKKRKIPRRKKETVAQRKKRMSIVRSYKKNPSSKRKQGRPSTTVKRGEYLHRPTVYTKYNTVQRKKRSGGKYIINPLSPQMKRTHSFISKIIIALESGHKVELEKKDLTSFRYILKNL